MSEHPGLPQPDPALRRLDRLVGRWSTEGHVVGSDETNIRGETSFRWLPGGFFLEQHVEMNFMGMQIESLEPIGYDPATKAFPSTVYSNLSPAPTAVPVGGRRRHGDDHGFVRSAGRDLHRLLARGRHLPRAAGGRTPAPTRP